MKKSNRYFEVKNPDAFFELRNGKVVLILEQSDSPHYSSSKPLKAFVEKHISDRLNPVPFGHPDNRENFVNFMMPLAKMLDDELHCNCTPSSSGKNLVITADRRELHDALAAEFEKMVKRLRALKYE